MKSYDQLAAQFQRSKNLQRCYIKDATDTERLILLTQEQIKAYRARNVMVRVVADY